MSTNDPSANHSQNPYSFQETPGAELPSDMQRGLVHHVPALGILTIVQGGLVTLLGLFLTGLAILVPYLLNANGGFGGPAGMQGRPMPPEARWVMMAAYGVSGILAVALGVLNIVGGVRMLKFRGRIFGIVSLSVGLLSIVGCYCFPTALGLFIYGLIVLLNEPVKRAFEMGAEGATSADIQSRFARFPAS